MIFFHIQIPKPIITFNIKKLKALYSKNLKLKLMVFILILIIID